MMWAQGGQLPAFAHHLRPFGSSRVEQGAPHEAGGKWDRIAWLKGWTSDKMSHAARIAQNPTR